MRIVGGKWGGRDLTSPGARVRPTAENVRAALFDALGAEVVGAIVLDLFAGSGALGLEAASRGASAVDFVESGPEALHALRANVAAFRIRDAGRIFKKDAAPFVEALEPDRYDIAFADPPYNSRVLDRILKAWGERRFSRVLVAEHARAHPMPAAAQRLAFDDTIVSIYRR